MGQSELCRRAGLLAAGHTDNELRRRCRTGALTLVRRGHYLSGSPPDDEVAQHLLAARAAVTELAADAVCSHVTAATIHGLPVWRIGLAQVHVTRARRSGARRGRLVHVHAAALAPSELGVVAGLPVTTPARTVVDLARGVPFEPAVAVADAALHAGLVTPEELAEALARAAHRPGAPAARRVVTFADGRSESVGESRSRVAMAQAGLPPPVPQWVVRDHGGRLVGRTDFGWPLLRTVGEFDGRAKYGRLRRPGQSAADAVVAEKLREDALRDQDLAVVRWTWADLADFGSTAARLRRRFRAA
jgi:predicted transcriptional regulator of viral defense system